MTKEQRLRKEKLRDLLAKNCESQASLARFCGVSTAAVAQWVTKGSYGYESAVKIASFFGVSFDWLYKDEGARIDTSPKNSGEYAPANEDYVAIDLSTYEAGDWKEIDNSPPFAFAADILTLGDASYPTNNCRLTRAQGDRMAPTIQNGDYILVSEYNRHIIDGSIYAFTIDGRFRIGRLAVIKDGLTVTSDNLAYRIEAYEGDEEIKRVHIIGKVCFVARAL